MNNIDPNLLQMLYDRAKDKNISPDDLLRQLLADEPHSPSDSNPTYLYLQAVLNNPFVGIMAFMAMRDGDGKIIDFKWKLANQYAQEIVGFAKDELLAGTLLTLLPGHIESGLFDVYVRVVETNQALSHVFHYSEDGINSWFENIAHPTQNDGFVVTFEDITEQKLAEEALRQSKEDYHILFQNAPIALWKRDFSDSKAYLDQIIASGVTNIETYLYDNPHEIAKCISLVKTLDANIVALKMYEVSSIDELNANMTKILSLDKTQSKSLAALIRNDLTFTGEFTNHTISGKPIQLLLSWLVMGGHETHYDEVIVASVDITAQKNAEQAMHHNKENYRLLFHEAPIAIWKQDFSAVKIFLDGLHKAGIVDIETHLHDNPADVVKCLKMVKIIEANPVAMQMYNTTTLEQIEANFDRLVDTGGQQPASLAAICMGEKHFEGVFINYPIVGKPIILLLRWIVMHGHEDTYNEVLVAGVDISNQQRYEQSVSENARLTANFRKEQEHNGLIQRSIAALAHDLRTPLSVIATSKELLLHYFDKLTEEKRNEKLESIGRQLEFALELLDDTVLSVRGTLNGRMLHPTAVHLAKLCKVSVEEVGASYYVENRLSFMNIAKINIFFVDEILVSRILLNLLSNAIKYSPDGGEIRLELDQTDTHVILRVIDSGLGMSQETQARIFEPFYRATDLPQKIIGSGLGLSIVQDCVMRHNGQIEVQSRLGFGTTFTVHLPITPPQPVPVMVE